MKVEQISRIEAFGDQVPENRQRGLARMMEQEEAFFNRVRLAMGAHREIGTIPASSGYRLSKPNCLLDWGLVELHGDRIGHNKVRFYVFPPFFSFSDILSKDERK